MQCESFGCLVPQQQICSTIAEFDILFLLKSVFDFIGMATGLCEAEEGLEREREETD